MPIYNSAQVQDLFTSSSSYFTFALNLEDFWMKIPPWHSLPSLWAASHGKFQSPAIPATPHPNQNAYSTNHSTEDAKTTTIHLALIHLENKDPDVRTHWFQFSNTILPKTVISKLLKDLFNLPVLHRVFRISLSLQKKSLPGLWKLFWCWQQCLITDKLASTSHPPSGRTPFISQTWGEGTLYKYFLSTGSQTSSLLVIPVQTLYVANTLHHLLHKPFNN